MLIFDKHREEYQVVGYKQFDTAEPLKARFLNDGQPINLADYTIRFECLKPDGHVVIDGTGITVKNTNEIEMMLNEQVTVVNGLVQCQFVLLRNADQVQDSTFTFWMDVQKSAIAIERYSDSVITMVETINTKINEATTKTSEITTATQQAEAKRVEVVEATNQANTSKTALDTSKQQADASKTALDQSKTNADASKTALDGSIGTANTTKGELDASNGTATNTKNELNTLNGTATTTKDQLTQINTQAGTTKTELEGVNSTATQTKTALEALNTTATQTNQALTTTNQTATTNNQTLTDTNNLAQQRKQELDQSIANAQNVVGGAELVTYDGAGVDISNERVRISHNGAYKLPVTQSDSVFLSDGTKSLTSWINEIESVINGKVNAEGSKVLSDNNYTSEDMNTVGQARTFLGQGGTVNGNVTVTGDITTTNIHINGQVNTPRVRGNTATPENVQMGTGNCRVDTDGGHMRLYTSLSGINDTGIQISSNGFIEFKANNITQHSFSADGKKTAGTMEVDGTVYGMSPTDSPQTLIEYIIPNVKVENELKLQLDKIYIKMIEYYVAFLSNKNIDIKEKGVDYIVLSGTGQTDVLIKGQRKGADDYFRIMGGLEHGNTKEQTL